MNFKNKSISPCGSFWDDFFKKKPRSPESFIKQLGKKHKIVFPSFFWNIKKNWDREKVRGVTSARKNPWIQILDSWFTFSNFSPQVEFPTMRRKSVSIVRSTTPAGGKKWWLISPAWTAAVGILGFCKHGFWGKSSDSPGLVRFCKYTICI